LNAPPTTLAGSAIASSASCVHDPRAAALLLGRLDRQAPQVNLNPRASFGHISSEAISLRRRDADDSSIATSERRTAMVAGRWHEQGRGH
jgi:hypothetical protein